MIWTCFEATRPEHLAITEQSLLCYDLKHCSKCTTELLKKKNQGFAMVWSSQSLNLNLTQALKVYVNGG